MSLIVVTGAGGGIGAAVCARLLEDGYSVLATDLAPEPALAKAPSLATAHAEGRLSYLPVDVTSEQSVAALGEYLRQLGKPLQGLVNCAGIVHTAPLLETSYVDWKRVQAVNADGVFLVTREVARLMLEQSDTDPINSRGIVTVSSNAATTPRTEFGAYGASKAAALQVSRSFGLQLAAHGIRVNTVSPGTTRTPMVTDPWDGQDLSAQPIAGNPASYRLGIPLGRIADPQDIAEPIAFLVSPAARHITLQNLTVDGGATF